MSPNTDQQLSSYQRNSTSSGAGQTTGLTRADSLREGSMVLDLWLLHAWILDFNPEELLK